jgi:dihydrofolate synthase/folylpolyglutamate synthase
MATYEELEQKMLRLASPGIRPGLERVSRLLDLLDNPEGRFPSVHIVGTNGKGSVSAFVSSVLRESGYRVATYTSPHLESPSERLVINGSPLSVAQWDDAIRRVSEVLRADSVLQNDPPSFFEVVTAVSFLLIAEDNVDIAVIEAGLGGRLDATNRLANVVLTLVVSISMDHIDFLGDSIEKIADEKFAVMRPATPCIFLGDPTSLIPRFLEVAFEKNAIPHVLRDIVEISNPEVTLDGSSFSLKSTVSDVSADISTPLLGTYQLRNGALSAAACIELRSRFPLITKESILAGFRKAQWPGRLERFGRGPVLLLDGAHNPGGMAQLVESIKILLPEKTISVLFAAMRDKDYRENLRILSEIRPRLFCTTVPGMERAENPGILAAAAREFNWKEKPIAYDDPESAFGYMLDRSDYALCCGSLYFIGYIRPIARKWATRNIL